MRDFITFYYHVRKFEKNTKRKNETVFSSVVYGIVADLSIHKKIECVKKQNLPRGLLVSVPYKNEITCVQFVLFSFSPSFFHQ